MKLNGWQKSSKAGLYRSARPASGLPRVEMSSAEDCRQAAARREMEDRRIEDELKREQCEVWD